MIRRIGTAIGILVACAAVLVLTGGKFGGGTEEGKTFKIAFDNAFGLTSGGDLRVGGVKAGQTTGFDLSEGKVCQDTPTPGPPRTCAIVTAQVNEAGFGSFRSDASCAIRQQSLIGEYYVDCQPGHAKTLLPKNAVIPAVRTTSTIPADLVNDVLRRPYRDRLRLIIAELGTGLAGRPQDLATLLRKAHPGLRETDRVLRILANQDTIIKNFITDSKTVVHQLDVRKNDLANWLVQASRAAEISATRRGAIAAGIQRFPTFLSELQTNMLRLGQLTDAQTPLLNDLHRAAPDLNTFFTKLGPFSQASRPSFRSLGDASVVGRRAFADSAGAIAQLRALAAKAPTTGKPLRQLLQTLDTRSRAVEPDPRAKLTAPPAPDPTATTSDKAGFTGFESIWNYVFWQTLAINPFDQYGHFLRAIGIVSGTCGKYVANAKALRNPNDPLRRCVGWLGPHEPGITVSDFSPETYNGSRNVPGGPGGSSTSTGKDGLPMLPPAKTKPLPGQTDWSKPHPTLPPSTQQLLNSLGVPAPSTPSTPHAPAPSTSSGSAEGILNYLLAP